MNKAIHSGNNAAYSAQCYEHSSTLAVIQLIAHSVINTSSPLAIIQLIVHSVMNIAAHWQ